MKVIIFLLLIIGTIYILDAEQIYTFDEASTHLSSLLKSIKIFFTT